jgi:hypothetical protein
MNRYIFIAFIGLVFVSACMPVHRSGRDQSGSSDLDLKCNIYVIDELAKKKITLPLLSANGLDGFLSNSSQWEVVPKKKNKLDHKMAYRQASRGKQVVVTYNSQSSASGHIAIVKSKKMVWSSGFASKVPFVWGSVNGKRPKIQLLSKHFASNKESSMNYYVYVGNKKIRKK